MACLKCLAGSRHLGNVGSFHLPFLHLAPSLICLAGPIQSVALIVSSLLSKTFSGFLLSHNLNKDATVWHSELQFSHSNDFQVFPHNCSSLCTSCISQIHCFIIMLPLLDKMSSLYYHCTCPSNPVSKTIAFTKLLTTWRWKWQPAEENKNTLRVVGM